MTDEQLEALVSAIEGRAAKATAGPWKLCPMGEYFFAADGSMVADHELTGPLGVGPIRMRGVGAEVSGHRPRGSIGYNAAFIAHAREDVPELCKIARAHVELRRNVHAMAVVLARLTEQTPRLTPTAFRDSVHLIAQELGELVGEQEGAAPS